MNAGGITAAIQVFSEFLDPTNPANTHVNIQDANIPWWIQDEEVTIDEIITVIAYHEGKSGVGESVRQAIYARYIFYMGGDDFYGIDTSQADSVSIDRLFRFLGYYEPWRDPGQVIQSSGVKFAEDISETAEAAEVREFFSTQGESVFGDDEALTGWDPDDNTDNGVVDIDEFLEVFGDRPFHFVTMPRLGYPEAIRTVIDAARNDDGSIDPGRVNHDGFLGVYDLIYNGLDVYCVVLTPNQAANLCPRTNAAGEVIDATGMNLGEGCQ